MLNAHISRGDLEHELERIRNRCARCHQDVSPEKIFEHHFHRLKAPGLNRFHLVCRSAFFHRRRRFCRTPTAGSRNPHR